MMFFGDLHVIAWRAREDQHAQVIVNCMAGLHSQLGSLRYQFLRDFVSEFGGSEYRSESARR